jgi:hypothetical protein
MKLLLTVYGDEAEFENASPEEMQQAMVTGTSTTRRPVRPAS